MDFDPICRYHVRLTEILERFPWELCFPRSRINENGDKFAFLSETHLEIPVVVTVKMEVSTKNVEATVIGLSNQRNSTTRSQ